MSTSGAQVQTAGSTDASGTPGSSDPSAGPEGSAAAATRASSDAAAEGATAGAETAAGAPKDVPEVNIGTQISGVTKRASSGLPLLLFFGLGALVVVGFLRSVATRGPTPIEDVDELDRAEMSDD
jgi:hypothetical protein